MTRPSPMPLVFIYEVPCTNPNNLNNLSYFLSQVPEVEEVSIGHALTADALEYGIESTVERYLFEIQSSYT